MSRCSTFVTFLIYDPLKILVSVLVTVFLVLPVIVIVFGSNAIVRLFVSCYLHLQFDGKVRLVSDGKDGIFCHLRKVYLRTLLEYDLPFDIEKFEKLIKNNLLSDGGGSSGTKDAYGWKMRQVITQQCGYFCWKEDENFTWSNHCRTLSTEKPVSRKQLLNIIDGLSDDLGELQPQWEVIYIPNIENKRFGILVNFHHGYSDGLALITMIAERLSPVKPFPYVLNPLVNTVPWQTRLLFDVKVYLFLGWAVLKLYLFLGWAVLKRFIRSRKNQDMKAFASVDELDEGIPEHCHLAKVDLPSDTIKTIRNMANVPIPAILISIYTKSLETILISRGDTVPKEIACGYTVTKFPYKKELSNRMVLIETEASVHKYGLDDNLVSSLEETATGLSKSFDECYATHDFSMVGKLPCKFIKVPRIAPGWFLHANIPFARKPVKIGGAVPVAVSAWPTLIRGYPYQLVASNISYGKTISACLIAKASKFSLEEMDELVKQLPRQLKALERYVCQQAHATMNDQDFDCLPARTSHICLHNAK
ncbi:unnamed protein product [Allacma fusca]|uniref:O-acyltransferase WSD1-like N-terminal domain-containing protein n=1 Tax=Allacma fusca TaxID=39272 RepID=A0A8J2PUF9_9HEXA|nr:unnamed protein product [Allacma fusca]